MKTKGSLLPTSASAKLMAGAVALGAAALGLGLVLKNEGTAEATSRPIAGPDTITATAAAGCCDGRQDKPITLSLRAGSGIKGDQAAPTTALPADLDPEVAALSANLAAATDRPAKLAAADALAAHGSPAAIEQLLGHALREPDHALRREMAAALDRLADREGFDAAVSAIGATRDRSVVAAVTDAVARMADGATVEQLVDLYRGPLQVRTQRSAVTRALAGIRNPDAARALSSIATSAPEPGLVEAAARGLSKIGGATAAQGLADAIENAGGVDAQLHASLLDLVQRIDDPAGLRVLQNLELMNP